MNCTNYIKKIKLQKLISHGFVFLCLLLLLLLSGCIAGKTSFNNGNLALEKQNYDQAVIEYLAAVESAPTNHEYKMRLSSASSKAALDHKSKGDAFLNKQQYVQALQEYQLATELDSSIFVIFDSMELARNHITAGKQLKEAKLLLQTNQHSQARQIITDILTMLPNYPPALQLKDKVRQNQFTLIDGVELEVTSSQPINLNFRDTKLPDVFNILTKLSGINFILDEDIRSNKTTLFLEQATFSQALELLLRMNKLDKKILNSKTIILYPKTRDKQKQFDDQVIQTFYLSHMDAKKTVNMLRTMLKVRKIFVNEELNAIVIRDKPDVIKLAQKMIEANDRGNSEVVFDLELIEVNHSDIRKIGLKLTPYEVSAGGSIPGSTAIIAEGLEGLTDTAGLIKSFNGLESFYSLPNATFRFAKTLGDAEILANPKIRVRNKEKAKVHIGTREPIVTTTTNNGVTSTNVQYIDVGVKLDIEPTIQLDNSIVTKVALEVSNVISPPGANVNGTSTITISSTNANTTLTLKDGEQTIMGGLIRSDSSVTKTKIPLLGDIPFIGELFTGTDKNKTKREILLSITPHIVKTVSLPKNDTASIWSGGEEDLKFGRNFGTFAADYKTGQQSIVTTVDKITSLPTHNKKAQKHKTPFTATKSTPTMNSIDPVVEEIINDKRIATLSENPIVSINGSQQVKQGEDFTLSCKVSDIKDLFSAPLFIHYNPAIFKFISATEGSLLQHKDALTIFTHTDISKSGKIIIGLKHGTSGLGTSGSGELFNIKFKALAPGKGEIKPTRTNFRNTRGKMIVVDSLGLTVKVAP